MRSALLLAVAFALVAGVSAAEARVTFRATASVSVHVQYLGDSTGVIYKVKVKNTGRTRIGSLEVKRPTSQFTIVGCNGAPAGWKGTKKAGTCTYRSGKSMRDDIRGGATKTFTIKATTKPGTADSAGSWRIRIGKGSKFKARGAKVAKASKANALKTAALSFQVLNAVVANAVLPGSACPAANKTAAAGSTYAVVICGRNRTSGTLTPSAAGSTLGGTFVGSAGSFGSAPVAPTTTSVVLGTWTGVTTAAGVGPGKNVLAKIGAALNQTSPATTLSGFSTTANQAPTAGDDAYPVDEDTPLSVAGPGVLENDTDPDGSALAAVLDSGPAHAAAFTLNADGSFTYTPAANYSGPDSFTYKANDGSADSNVATADITVAAVNDPPANSVPGAQTTPMNTGRIFSAANGNLISTSDLESSSVRVTLGVAHGSLTLSTLLGLTFTVGDGTADPTMTFFGTLASVNAAIAALSYFPAAAYTGPDTLTITTNDQTNGMGLSDTDTVAITVLGPNIAPINTVPGAQTTNEDTARVFSVTNANLISTADADAGTSPVQITLSVTNGTLTLSGTTGLIFTVGDGTSDASMAFTGTLVNVNAALAGMSYAPTANYNGPAVLTLTTNDQGNTGTGGPKSDTDTVAITVSAVNDAPVNTVPGGQTTTEEVNRVFSVANGNRISVADVDAANVTVTLSGTSGVVTLAGTAGLVFTQGDGTSDSTMQFSGTLASVNTALATVTFTPTPNFNGAAQLSIHTSDNGQTGAGGTQSDADAVPITVNAVNDAPVNTVPGAQTVNTDSSKTFSTANGNLISVADVDAAPDTVQVTLVVLHGVLTLSGTTGLTFTAGDGTNDVAMAFSGTLVNANAALNGLVYAPTLDYDGPDTLSITTSDLGHTGSGGTLTDADTVAITVVNPPPVAVNDTFNGAIGNTIFAVGVNPGLSTPVVQVAGNVLTNDSDPDGEALSAGPLGTDGITTSKGGKVTMNANGTFVLTPKEGSSGTDTFTYTVSDAHGSNTATVSVPITGMVWYVNGANASAGTGRSSDPYKTLAPLTAAGELDASGDTVFLYPGTYTGGLALEASQKLFSKRHGLVVGMTTLEAAAAAGPISKIEGGLVLASGNTIQGVDLGTTGSSSVFALSGTSVGTTAINSATSGGINNPAGGAVSIGGAGNALTVALSDLSSSGSSTTAVSIANASGTFTASAGTLTSATGTTLNLDGGTLDFTFGGSVTDTTGQLVSIANQTGGTKDFNGTVNGGSVSLSSNTGATIRFDGTTTLSTGASSGFSASGGGTVVVTGADNTLVSTTGTTLNVANTTIGADGLTFKSINTNGAPSGIVLTSTGTSGGLTVTGIASPPTVGSGGVIQNTTNSGVQATSTSLLNLSRMTFGSNGDAVNEGAIRLTDLTGPSTITSPSVSGSAEDGIYLSNQTGGGGALTIQGPSCAIQNNNVTTGNTGINVLSGGTRNTTVTVNNCTFTGNRTIAIHADAGDSSTLTSTITQNTITRGTAGNNPGNQGIEVSAAGSATHTFTVSNNSVGSAGVSGLTSTGINVFNGSAASALLRGRVSLNSVQNDTTTAAGNSNGWGIRVFNSNLAQTKVRITGNTVRGSNTDYGILAESSGTVAAPIGTLGRLDVEVASNTVGVNAGALDLIRVQGRNFNTVCSKVSGNEEFGAIPVGFFGITLREADSAVVNYEGTATPAGILALNPGMPAGSTSVVGTPTSVAANTCDFTGVP